MIAVPEKFFDPNVGKCAWAVSQGPTDFKVYRQKGHATNRLGTDRNGVIYELTTNGWEVRILRDSNHEPTNCEGCGCLQEKLDGYRRHQYKLRWYINRRYGKILDPLGQKFLCEPCNSLENHA